MRDPVVGYLDCVGGERAVNLVVDFGEYCWVGECCVLFGYGVDYVGLCGAVECVWVVECVGGVGELWVELGIEGVGYYWVWVVCCVC